MEPLESSTLCEISSSVRDSALERNKEDSDDEITVSKDSTYIIAYLNTSGLVFAEYRGNLLRFRGSCVGSRRGNWGETDESVFIPSREAPSGTTVGA